MMVIQLIVETPENILHLDINFERTGGGVHVGIDFTFE